MDDREQQRKIRHRLAVLRHAEEVSGNFAATCRYYGISRTVFYKRRNRFDELGAEGLRDRSSRPHHSPTATKGEVVEPDRAPAPELPLRASTDRDVPQALPRRRDLLVRGVAHPGPAGARPAAGEPALPAPHPAPEALRETAAGPPGADRRQVHRSHRRGHDQAALPVHRHRRLHPAAGVAHLPQGQPTHSNRVHRLRHGAAPVPDRGHPDRQRRRVPGPASVGTCSTAASATSTSSPPPPGSTTRSNTHTASTPKSSTDCSKASPSTTPTCSTTGAAYGRTTTTSNDSTAASTARPPMKDSNRKPPNPDVNRLRQQHS